MAKGLRNIDFFFFFNHAVLVGNETGIEKDQVGGA